MISSEVYEIFKNRVNLRTIASDFGFILLTYFYNWIRENSVEMIVVCGKSQF